MSGGEHQKRNLVLFFKVFLRIQSRFDRRKVHPNRFVFYITHDDEVELDITIRKRSGFICSESTNSFKRPQHRNETLFVLLINQNYSKRTSIFILPKSTMSGFDPHIFIPIVMVGVFCMFVAFVLYYACKQTKEAAAHQEAVMGHVMGRMVHQMGAAYEGEASATANASSSKQKYPSSYAATFAQQHGTTTTSRAGRGFFGSTPSHLRNGGHFDVETGGGFSSSSGGGGGFSSSSGGCSGGGISSGGGCDSGGGGGGGCD